MNAPEANTKHLHQTDISARIQVLRVVLILGIVVLHTPPYVPIEEVPREAFAVVKAFFQDALFRLSVPALSAISGYLLFRYQQDRDFPQLARKKSKSLLLPFLFWNVPLASAIFFLQSHGVMLNVSPNLVEADFGGWMDALFAVNGEPVNYPLAFVRDILVACMIASILSSLFRRMPVFLAITVFLVSYTDLDGSIFLRADIATLFFVGGLLSVLDADVTLLDRWAIHLGLLLLLLCCIFVLVADSSLLFWLRVIGVVCLWPVSGVLCRFIPTSLIERLGNVSFWIFCSHAPILALLWTVWQRHMPDVAYPVFWVLAPIATVLLSVAAYGILRRILPGLASMLTGSRPAVRVRV